MEGDPNDQRTLRLASPLRTSLARVLGIHTDERAWRRGAAGERTTAWWLGRLPDGWHLLNDIPVGERGANLDHLIVAPGGVFTINAKNLTGKVWVAPAEIRHNGHRTDFIRTATAEAARASTLLTTALGWPVSARPVIAILADDWTIRGGPSDVFVGSPRGVKDWLRRQPVVLDPRMITAIVSAAAKPETWL